MKVWNFSIGYVNIRIMGKYPEKLLNRLTEESVPLKQVRRSGDVITADVPASRIYDLKRLRRGTGCSVKIRGKHPILYARMRLRSNAVFAISLAVFALAAIAASTRLWFIDVHADNIPREDVLSEVTQLGVRVGSRRDRNMLSQISSALNNDPRIVNAKVTLTGVVLRIDVSESSGPIPELGSEAAVGIYADKDCVIRSISVTSGRAKVKAGQAVRKGDLLVSGDLTEMKEGYFVPARAQIIGEVLYRAQATAPRQIESLVRSGSSVRAAAISVFGREFFASLPYERYDKEPVRSGVLAACPIPVGIKTYEVFEIVVSKAPDSDEGTELRARLSAQEKLKGMLPAEAEIKTTHTQIIKNDDGSVTASVTVTVDEPIGYSGE